jgi:calcium-translocating P-type ATPase
MGFAVVVALASLIERTSGLAIPASLGAATHFIQSDVAPLLRPAEASSYNELYPSKLAKEVLVAEHFFVGGAVLLFFVASSYARRKEPVAAVKIDPAVTFFAKRGDRSLSHTIDIESAATVMDTSLDGITGVGAIGLLAAEAADRLSKFGANALTPPERENRFVMLLKQVFGGLFNIMLWCCVAAEIFIAWYFGGDDLVTPVVLSIVIVSSGVLQWWTELRAMMMMESLQAMSSSPKVSVYRDGATVYVDAAALVPGDIIALEAGDKIPADIRVVKMTDGAEVDNAALTGESVPEPRMITPDGPNSPMLEARSMAFLGTTLVKGRILACVIYTGDSTALGNIAQSINSARTRSSLEMQIEHFVHIIAGVAVAVGILSCVANILSPQKRSWGHILENSATAFFAQVPEGLLPTVTISLMIAANKMTKRRVLVRKIDAVETLGCISILCSDKTGTLTTGEMSLIDSLPLGDYSQEEFNLASPASRTLFECGMLNNATNGVVGSPTEVAIVRGLKKLHESTGETFDLEAFRKANPTVFEVPFNSENKWALTIHPIPNTDGCGYRVILKGAPERIYPFCRGDSSEADDVCSGLMRQGRRVLAFASKDLDLSPDFAFAGSSADNTNFDMTDLRFVGLVGLEDPPKEGIVSALNAIKRAGVRPVMVTGDHPTTAQAIAERIGIATEGDENSCITGPVMSTMLPVGETFNDDVDPKAIQDFWKEVTGHATIFARVSPSHKKIIVQAYQHYGKNITAMTGDGVNDAPALKQAEVGIAMGIRGTEVAKEAADIVLLDDELQSVVAGMEQGRLCSENLRKSILYTLCSKVPQVVPTFAELLGVPTALTVAQVLLIDIGTDIWTAIAFAWQPAESALMTVPPRNPRKEHMVTPRVLAYSYGYMGMLQMLLCFFVFFHAVPHMWTMFESYEFKHVNDHAAADQAQNYLGMTAYYWTLVLGQVAAAMATTTTRESLFTYGLPNMMLNLCIVAEIVFALVIMYWKPAQDTFKTSSLAFHQVCLGMLGFLVIFVLEEIRKKVVVLKEKQEKAFHA